MKTEEDFAFQKADYEPSAVLLFGSAMPILFVAERELIIRGTPSSPGKVNFQKAPKPPSDAVRTNAGASVLHSR